MRVVFAPDSFSGTLSALDAAGAMAAGWRRQRSYDDIVISPMADGGDGTLAVVASARPDAMTHQVEVADARGVATTAAWLTLPDGTAVIETAQAIGLHRLSPEHRNPLHTTTYGVGQLVRAALAGPPAMAPPPRLIVGLGGSATVDGGAGMISALTGHGLRRADGNGVRVGGRWVGDVVEVRPMPGLPAIEVVVASDVDAPLLGPTGAAQVFGPQKGADPAAVAELEEGITRLADVVEDCLPGGPWRDRSGAGAAGGLGFALMALLGARMASGAEVVADLTGLTFSGAGVVVTGEGRLDAQTAGGKAPSVVSRRARAAGARVLAIAGEVTGDLGDLVDDAVALGDAGLADPAGAVTAAAERLARSVVD